MSQDHQFAQFLRTIGRRPRLSRPLERAEPLDPERIAALWRGEIDLPAPEAAVTGTMALALSVLGRARGQDRGAGHGRDHVARPAQGQHRRGQCARRLTGARLHKNRR